MGELDALNAMWGASPANGSAGADSDVARAVAPLRGSGTHNDGFRSPQTRKQLTPAGDANPKPARKTKDTSRAAPSPPSSVGSSSSRDLPIELHPPSTPRSTTASPANETPPRHPPCSPCLTTGELVHRRRAPHACAHECRTTPRLLRLSCSKQQASRRRSPASAVSQNKLDYCRLHNIHLLYNRDFLRLP
ncbi:hypothetical protein HU200_038270 [Digitaria exilis]|uniref:Uncharacterized protein n=1 Tax=Digitaria exilis TaxID=1010633 RepID=A0A835EJD2_9POAL|nr:hypothetical protein HU200_038270 [Digitaria exilis]